MGRVTNNYRLRTEGMTGSMRRRSAEREIASSEARHREDMAAIERHKKATGQVSDPAAEREAALKRYKERSGGHVYQYKE